MLLQWLFPFPAFKQKNYFSKKMSYSLRLLFAFTNLIVFNDGQITEREK